MKDRNDGTMVRDAYIRMYEGMICKDRDILESVLDDSFVLIHMTGMRQAKEVFIKAVLDGTLNYYSAEHENIKTEVHGDHAELTGQSYVEAAVFGGGRSHWHLQLKCSFINTDEGWKISRCSAGTY